MMKIATIEKALASLGEGRMVILADDEQRENEGDFVMIAQLATKEAITFMAEQARTIITLALTAERCELLKLPLMARDDTHTQDTAFTITIEAAKNVTTGSSALDRLRTIRAAVATDAKPEDLVRPGHVFPLRADPGGVLNRAGHTEAASDLARMAGFEPAGLISEIQLPNGEMARMPDLEKIADEHGLLLTTIAKLIEYRCRNESLISRELETDIATSYGDFMGYFYSDTVSNGNHLALVKGKPKKGSVPLVRVLDNPSFLDALSLASPHRSWTAAAALRQIAEVDYGILLALRIDQPAKRVVETSKTIAQPSSLQVRNYGIGAQVLRDLGVSDMKLLSSPLHLPSMEGFGLNVLETITPADTDG